MTTNSWLKDDRSVPKTDSISEPRSYRASVPLCIYRELVQELKETQGQVVILHQQNQRLRQQIEDMISVTSKLNQVGQTRDTVDSVNSIEPIISPKPKLTFTHKSLIESINGTQQKSLSFFQPQHYNTNIALQTPVSQLKREDGINGWILAAAIVLIVLTSCTGAFLIVNSRLSYSSR